MSTVATISTPAVGRSNAASSPTPSATDAERGGRRKNRSMISNSFTLSAAETRRLPDADRRQALQRSDRTEHAVSLHRPSRHFAGAELHGELVEDTVDVLVAVGPSVGLGQLDCLVDHDAVRYVQAMLQLPCA